MLFDQVFNFIDRVLLDKKRFQMSTMFNMVTQSQLLPLIHDSSGKIPGPSAILQPLQRLWRIGKLPKLWEDEGEKKKRGMQLMN